MKATGFNTFMARIDAAEYGLCRRLNRGASFAIPRRIFRIASRLGDGIVWYVLIFALPVLYGAAGVRPAIVMALTGALGVALYSLLKHLFVRERPFITHTAIDPARSEEHTSELQSRLHLVCRLLLEKKKDSFQLRVVSVWFAPRRSAICDAGARSTSARRREFETTSTPSVDLFNRLHPLPHWLATRPL